MGPSDRATWRLKRMWRLLSGRLHPISAIPCWVWRLAAPSLTRSLSTGRLLCFHPPPKAHGPGHAVSDLRGPHQAPNKEGSGSLWKYGALGPLADSSPLRHRRAGAPSGVPSAPTLGAPDPRQHLPEQAGKAQVCGAQQPLLGSRVQQAVSVSRPSREAPLPGSVCTSAGRARTAGLSSRLECPGSQPPSCPSPRWGLPRRTHAPDGEVARGRARHLPKGAAGPRCSTCVQTCPQPLGPQGEGEAP